MRLKTIFKTILFSLYTLTAFSMSGRGRCGRPGFAEDRYGSTTLNHERQGYQRNSASDLTEHSAQVTRIPDGGGVQERPATEPLTSDSDVTDKIKAIQTIGRRWQQVLEDTRQSSDRVEQTSSSVIDLETAINDVAKDIELLEKEKVSVFLDEANLQERKSALLTKLSQEIEMAIVHAQGAQKWYQMLLEESLNERKVGTSSIQETFIPTLQGPISANTLQEIYEKWHHHAEIRYDQDKRHYISYQCERRGFLNRIGRTVARSEQARKEHRAAIEKVAQELGTDQMQSFNAHWIVSMKKFLGEPLTLHAIKKVREEIEAQNRRTNSAHIASELRSTITSFIEGVVQLWQQNSDRRGYQQI